MLDDFVDLKPGDAVVYNAANSGLARWLGVIARKKALRMIGLIRREADIAAVEAAGCEFVVVDSESSDDALKRLDGLNVRLGLDVLGGSSDGACAGISEPGRQIRQLWFGNGTATATLRFFNHIQAGHRGRLFCWFPEQAHKAFSKLPELGKIFAADKIEQPISAVYPIDSVRDAAEHASQGGRVLLSMIE